MKIARWFFDVVSWIVYGLGAYILKVIYSIEIAIIGSILMYIIGIVFRVFLIDRPINNMVDFVNEIEKNNLEV